jgi:hypothetical protein
MQSHDRGGVWSCQAPQGIELMCDVTTRECRSGDNSSTKLILNLPTSHSFYPQYFPSSVRTAAFVSVTSRLPALAYLILFFIALLRLSLARNVCGLRISHPSIAVDRIDQKK